MNAYQSKCMKYCLFNIIAFIIKLTAGFLLKLLLNVDAMNSCRLRSTFPSSYKELNAGYNP